MRLLTTVTVLAGLFTPMYSIDGNGDAHHGPPQQGLQDSEPVSKAQAAEEPLDRVAAAWKEILGASYERSGLGELTADQRELVLDRVEQRIQLMTPPRQLIDAAFSEMERSGWSQESISWGSLERRDALVVDSRYGHRRYATTDLPLGFGPVSAPTGRYWVKHASFSEGISDLLLGHRTYRIQFANWVEVR